MNKYCIAGEYVWLQLWNEDDKKVIRLLALVSEVEPPQRGSDGLGGYGVLEKDYKHTLHVFDTRKGHSPIWIARNVTKGYDGSESHWKWFREPMFGINNW